MNSAAIDDATPRQSGPRRGWLRRKYLAWCVVAAATGFLTYRALDAWLFCQDQTALTMRMQRQETETAAARIDRFFDGIADQMRWLVQMPWDAGTVAEWHLDTVRLLRQVPAITEIARIDAAGREQVRVSRIALDVVGSQADFSSDPTFTQAMASKLYHGPIYFRRGSEPYMTLAVAGTREADGIVVAEVNLKFIHDLVSDLKRADQATVFAVDNRGRLIAHPDISLVLRNIDLSEVDLVRTAMARTLGPKAERSSADIADDERAATMSAPVPSLGGVLIFCRAKAPADPTTSALCDPARTATRPG